MPDSHSYIQLRIESIISETSKAKTFILKQVSGEPIVYKPGQFLNFVFPKRDGEDRRSYSIASSPERNEPLAVTMKYVTNGEYSRRLMERVREGAILLCAGVSGFFTLPENIKDYRQLFFFAAGSGITPVFSLIKSALLLYPFLKINLVYSNRSKADAIFFDALSGLQKQYEDRFSVLFLFSTSKDLMQSRLNSFMISGMMQEIVQQPLSKVLFYVCGPFEYMDNVIITLLTEGVARENIKKETLPPSCPLSKESRPIRISIRSLLRSGISRLSWMCNTPSAFCRKPKSKAIIYLTVASQANAAAAQRVAQKGKVWMFYNEVLTEKDLQQGLVLTCTGFPVDGDVELEYE